MEQASDQKVAFLLGAGASAEAGVSTSQKITEILINYGSYCPSEGSIEIENILKYIQVRIADYLGVRASDVNFEFLLGTLMELSDRQRLPVVPLLGEGDLLIRKLEQKIPLPRVVHKLYALLRELLFLTGSVNYFYPLKDFLELSKPLDFFTLNYDLSLESAFNSLGIRYTTGYRPREEELPIWDPSRFNDESLDARVFKLHGSIDWGHFYICPLPTQERRSFESTQETESFVANYPERVQFQAHPVRLVEPPGRTAGMVSIMNFGTRKEQLYASSQFTVLFHHFLTCLRRSNTLVIAGYSFQDQAISRIIEEAVAEKRGDLHLVVVDPGIFWIKDRYPVLSTFVEWQWVTEIRESLGEALTKGSLRKAVEAAMKPNRIPEETKLDTPEQPSTNERAAADPERVLQAWCQLGITFDLAYSWWKRLAPELERLQQSINDENATKIGQLLMPLIRKVRDLCYHIRFVYEEMRFGGTYAGEYIESIIVSPTKVTTLDEKLLSRWLPNLGMAVNLVFNTCHDATEEFSRAVRDPNYGKDSGAPSNFSMAELIIRKTKSRIYELVWLLNDIYKGAGFEEPFAKIAKDQAVKEE